MAGRIVFVALALVLSSWTRARAQVDVAEGVRADAPIPSWAEHVDVPAPSDVPEGLQVLLHDVQWNVDGDAATELVRTAYVLRTTAAVEQASQISIEIPSRSDLVLHEITRTRDGVS